MKPIKLGWKVKDSITGFTGIVTSRTEFLYGCVRIGVCPDKLDKDGKIIEAQAFDEAQCKVLEEVTTSTKSAAIALEHRPPAGDRPNPSARPRATPKR